MGVNGGSPQKDDCTCKLRAREDLARCLYPDPWSPWPCSYFSRDQGSVKPCSLPLRAHAYRSLWPSPASTRAGLLRPTRSSEPGSLSFMPYT